MKDASYTVMIVDHDATARCSKSRILRHAGCRVVEAGNGAEALRIVHDVSPALVVLALNLPDIDGLEVCRRIKADSSINRTMVLLVSTSGGPGADRVLALDVGADSYLAEPAEPEELVGWAKSLLRLHKREAENADLLARVRDREQLLRRTFEQAGDAILLCDRTGRIQRASRKARDLAGSVLVDKRLDQVFSLEAESSQPLGSPEGSSRSEPSLFESCMTGTANNQEICFRRTDGEIFHLLLTCGVLPADGSDEPAGYVITLTDITRRKEAEKALQRRNDGLRLLNEASAELLTSSDPRRMIENLFVRVSDYLSADMFFNYMVDEDTGEDAPTLSLETAGGVEESARQPIRRLQMGEAVCGTSAQERRAIYVPDVQHSDDPKCSSIAALNVRAYVCFPLIAGERVIGTLSFGSKRKDHFGSEELDFLRALTHQVACAKEWLKAVQGLKKSEEEFRAAFDAAGIGRAQLDPRTGRFIRVNAKLCEILGYSRDELIGKSFLDFTHAEDRGRNLEAVEPFFRGEVPDYTIEKRYIRSDGTVIWCSVTGVLMKDSGGNPLAALTEVQDITERRKTEEALRESEQRFRTLADSSPVLIWVTNSEGGTEFFNHAYREFFGVTEEDVKGPKWRSLVHPDDLERYANAYYDSVRDRKPFRAQARVRRADGEWRWIDSYGLPRFSSSGEFLGHVGSSPDVTDVKRAEEALRENQARLDLAQKTAKAGIWDWDIAENRMTWSDALWELFGLPAGSCEASYDLWRSCVHPEDRALAEAKVQSVIANGTEYSNEFRVITGDGRILWHASRGELIRDSSGRPKRLIGINIDITERKRMEDDLRKFTTEMGKIVAERTAALEAANAEIVRELEERRSLEEQLREAQKMESIGTLAGGIAHDFNNTLNIIRAYISLLEEHRCSGEDISESLKIIDEAVDSGASTVRQLLTLASKADVELEAVDVDGLIAQVGRILGQTLPKTIEISLKRTPRLPPVVLDRNQIIQALVNLCVNARDAMPSGGELTLASGIIESSDIRYRHPEARAARYVFIEVSDTGEGMEESVRKRIFDPFFTTKEPGKGTGLGLSVVFGIVKKHDGFIHVESRPQHGTKFRIYLPVAGSIKDAVPPGTAGETSLARDPSGTRGTILIVEDNVLTSELLRKSFSHWGFHVLAAEDGEAALRVYRQHKQAIDVVLLDIGLPKIAGEQVLSRMKQDNPELAVVVASGYIDPALKTNLLEAGVEAFVSKPYHLPQLYAAIRAALERRAAVQHC